MCAIAWFSFKIKNFMPNQHLKSLNKASHRVHIFSSRARHIQDPNNNCGILENFHFHDFILMNASSYEVKHQIEITQHHHQWGVMRCHAIFSRKFNLFHWLFTLHIKCHTHSIQNETIFTNDVFEPLFKQWTFVESRFFHTCSSNTFKLVVMFFYDIYCECRTHGKGGF